MVNKNVPVEQMTPAQREVAFNKWLENQASKKITSQAKRAATKSVIEAHQDEYDRALAFHKTQLMGGFPSNGTGATGEEEEEDEDTED
jgi:hypothetical protein